MILIFRIGVSLIFLMTAVPKVLQWGRSPSRILKDKIVWKKAGFVDMEVIAAYHTWQAAFGYPTVLFRPLGIVLIFAVVALNIYPPPSAIGYHACFFLVMVLGGGMWTWLLNYRSPRNCVPMFVTLLGLTILTSVKEDISGAEIVNPTAWLRTLMMRTLLPLVLGLMGGPVLKYLGKLEEHHRD